MPPLQTASRDRSQTSPGLLGCPRPLRRSNSATARLARAALLSLSVPFLTTLLAAATPSAHTDTAHLFERAVQQGAVALTADWLLAEGDDPQWAAPELDDSHWQPVVTTERLGDRDGVTWLRLHLDVEPSLLHVPLAFFLELDGSAELWLDGRRIAGIGELRNDAESGRPLQSLVLSEAETVIAVRHLPRPGGLEWLEAVNGFRLTIGRVADTAGYAAALSRVLGGHQMMFVGAFLGQSILHFLLFGFYPRFRSNLWFALTTLSSAALAGLQFERVLSEDPDAVRLVTRVWTVLLFVTMGLLLRFVHEVFDEPLRWRFWSLLGLGAASLTVALARPDLDPFSDLWWYHLLMLAEALRIIVSALRRGWRGAWMIGLGTSFLAVCLSWQLLLVIGIEPPTKIFPVAYYGVGGLLLSVSVYLAYGFARLGRGLEERLVEVERLSKVTLDQELRAKEEETRRLLLEADNERKTEELQAARELQLALLPARPPELDDLEIAVSMRTATEVGGDFYDFHVDGDTLTVAIGDAAGHGAKAGAMVSLMKGMFGAVGSQGELPRFFAEATSRVRALRLDGLQMAMALLRLRGDRLLFSSAGMPPALLYRADSGQVEELLIEGMPLGGLPGFRYRQREADFRSHDVLLLTSDGLPELVDDDGRTFGYERIQRLLAERGAEGASAVVAALDAAAREWLDGGACPDDLTFVALGKRDG